MNTNTSAESLALSNVTTMDTPHANNAAQKSADSEATTVANAFQAGVTAEILAEDLEVSMAIGAEDVIEGKIKIGAGKSLLIRGIVKGDIECGGRVVIMPGGKVLGKIHAAALWIEGDVGEPKNPAIVDVGDLHLGVNSRVIGDCTYDMMGVAMPNRGIRGQLNPRSETEAANA